MMNEWFPNGFSVEQAKQHIVVDVEVKSSSKLRDLIGEYDSDYTPLMLYRSYDVFGGYERDYQIFLHRDLREDLQFEMLFTGLSIAYISQHGIHSKATPKWLIRDYVSKDSFNSLCDIIRKYYQSNF